MGLLDGKVVLVTGGSRNVGAGIVRCMAREGATVAINYLQDTDKANALATSIRGSGGTAGVWQCDVRDPHAVLQMMEDIVRQLGRIDGLVNNARHSGPRSEPTESDPVRWADHAREFEYYVRTVLNTVHAARPFMKAQGIGRIVNIVSTAWNHPWFGEGDYAAGKGGMIGLTRCLVLELAPDGITINMVSPGWTRTDKTPEDANSSSYAKSVPFKRLAECEEVGDACVFLISDLARFVTGAYIPVDGGRSPMMGG